jgi:hypothetical protein
MFSDCSDAWWAGIKGMTKLPGVPVTVARGRPGETAEAGVVHRAAAVAGATGEQCAADRLPGSPHGQLPDGGRDPYYGDFLTVVGHERHAMGPPVT